MCQSLHGQNFLQYNCKLSQHYLKYLAFPAINPISGQISHNDTYYTFILNTAILFTSASFFYTHFSIALTYPPPWGIYCTQKEGFSMRILLLTLSSLWIPTLAFAHSGTVFRAFANYLPFIMPCIIATAIAAKKLMENFWHQRKNKQPRSNK